MKKKTPKLPSELAAFIKQDHTTFHCEDGDWELRIEAKENSEYGDDLPARSTVIAENGCGDCLFLKTSPAGKIVPQVYVYWHEEERDEVFVKTVKELTAGQPKAKAATPKAAAKGAKDSGALKKLEQGLKSSKALERVEAVQSFRDTEFGVEALPALRRALADSFISVVILAAECIAKLGPKALSCDAGEASMPMDMAPPSSGDLESQLMYAGSKVWSYSGYANAHSTCLQALVNLKADSDVIVELAQTFIGSVNEDDLFVSLEALQRVKTSEARDLAKRAAAFWMSELNLAEAKKVKAILASTGSAKSPKKTAKKK